MRMFVLGFIIIFIGVWIAVMLWPKREDEDPIHGEWIKTLDQDNDNF